MWLKRLLVGVNQSFPPPGFAENHSIIFCYKCKYVGDSTANFPLPLLSVTMWKDLFMNVFISASPVCGVSRPLTTRYSVRSFCASLVSCVSALPSLSSIVCNVLACFSNCCFNSLPFLSWDQSNSKYLLGNLYSRQGCIVLPIITGSWIRKTKLSFLVPSFPRLSGSMFNVLMPNFFSLLFFFRVLYASL